MDPFAHLSYRSSSDHQAMARAGVSAVVEPCTWPGQPRTAPEGFRDHFMGLVGFERARAGQYGIRYFSALSLNPREANDHELAPPVLNLLPMFLAKETVVALGETGYDAMTEAEDAAFEWQLDLAKRFKLPVLVRVPAAERSRAIRRALSILRRSGIPETMVLIGPNDEETMPAVLAAGYWAGYTLNTRARFDAPRMAAIVRHVGVERTIVGSGADWDLTDAMAIPALTEVLRQSGVTENSIDHLLWRNPLTFFAQSGRMPADLLVELKAAPAPAPKAAAEHARKA